MTIIPDTDTFEAARKAHFAVTLHSPSDFEGMRRAGRLAAEVLDLLVPLVKPGVTTAALDKVAYDYVVAHGAHPACLGYRGYRHTVCTSINHVVCHGIPNDKPLRDGDIVNIDVTVILDGWHGDHSRMYPVGDVKLKAMRLIDITYESMMRGIARHQARRHHRRYRPCHPILRRRRGALRRGARFLRPWPGHAFSMPCPTSCITASPVMAWRSSPACSSPSSR